MPPLLRRSDRPGAAQLRDWNGPPDATDPAPRATIESERFDATAPLHGEQAGHVDHARIARRRLERPTIGRLRSSPVPVGVDLYQSHLRLGLREIRLERQRTPHRIASARIAFCDDIFAVQDAVAVEARRKEPPSIAVLPFVNRSRNEEDGYFSDGLADELLNVLAKIRGLPWRRGPRRSSSRARPTISR